MNQQQDHQDINLSCIENQKKPVTKAIAKNGQICKLIYQQLDQVSQLSFRGTLSTRQSSQLHNSNSQMFRPKVQLLKQVQERDHERTDIFIVKTALIQKENIYSHFKAVEAASQKYQKYYLQKAELISQVLIKLIILLLPRSNYQLYTNKTILIHLNDETDAVNIHVDEASAVGLDLLLYGEPISFQDFAEVFELVRVKQLSSENPHGLSYQLKIRAIAKILLDLILGKKISLFAQFCRMKGIEFKKQALIQKKRCLDYSQELRVLFRNLLTNQQFPKLTQKLQINSKVNYSQFLRQVFVEEKQMEWQQVIRLLVPQTTLSQKKYIHHQKSINFQEIMQQLQLSRQRTYGSQYINKLKQLGLYNQPKPLFIALMSQYTPFAEQAICYEDMNQLLYKPNSYDLAVRDAVFSFVLGLLGELTDNRPCFQAKKYISSIRDLVYKQNIQEQKSLSDHPQQLIQNNYQPQPKKQLSDIQKSVAANFGRYQARISGKRFITQNYYSAGLSKFMKRLK